MATVFIAFLSYYDRMQHSTDFGSMSPTMQAVKSIDMPASTSLANLLKKATFANLCAIIFR